MGTCFFFVDLFMPTPRPVRGMVDVVSTLPVFLSSPLTGCLEAPLFEGLDLRCCWLATGHWVWGFLERFNGYLLLLLRLVYANAARCARHG